jgi:hypothetical protein
MFSFYDPAGSVSAASMASDYSSPTQKFIRMRQNESGRTVLLPSQHSRDYAEFRSSVNQSTNDDLVHAGKYEPSVFSRFAGVENRHAMPADVREILNKSLFDL